MSFRFETRATWLQISGLAGEPGEGRLKAIRTGPCSLDHMSEAMSHFSTPARALAPAPEAVVCVPTFRRAKMLERTLRSLAEQRTRVPFAIVVVDNDGVKRDGFAAATRFLSDAALPGHVCVEPQQGNVHAINRAFATALAQYAQARYFLMIDDDEIAEPDWLDAMVAAARRGCDIVGGPVLPMFGCIAGAHRRHPVFQPAYSASGPVHMIYGSGNCLITREAFARLGAFFDPSFNFLGGGDTEFFTRAKAAGLRFFWAQNAVVHELVGPERVTATWILQRGLRIGAINYRIDCMRARGLRARGKVLVKNAGVAAFAAYKALLLVLSRAPVLETLHPLIVALGRLLAAFGIYPEQYRAKPRDVRP
jgi:GT2 family glycosyltransferase